MKKFAFLKSIYHNFYNWLLSPKDKFDQVHLFKVHSMLVITSATGILMWGYAITAYYYINHPSIKYTGFFYAFIHLMAPLVYKYTGSIKKALYTIIIPGGLFQIHYALLTAGFLSPILVWIAILPVITGILSNMKHTIFVSSAVCVVVSVIAYLDLSLGTFTKSYLLAEGVALNHILTAFGMIFLHSGFTISLIQLRKVSEDQLRSRAISKQNLLRVIAHDVTNPITVIKNNIAFLNKHVGVNGHADMYPKIKKKLVATEKSSNTIFNLISSVKEIEAFESGKKQLEIQRVSITQCVDECLDILSDMITEKEITVRILMDDDHIWGIKSVIEHQIICNIVTNTIKFSENKSEILIHSKKVNKEVHLIIKDQGIGIPDYILRKIFDPLASTSRLGTNGEKGTGFGLPIAKRSIGLLGGTLQITSRTSYEYIEDHGTIFKICFQNADYSFLQSIKA
ncbi:sensor histidine kinase KdpD [Halobacteriovorax sp. HLS]|uniref:sensor histidine kinase n=1 Tax=Halobacteriovorax sp. HLS TaxID=2234000 RepID=UPI000FD86952|nr:HAMP domain-containing sensor histidine kinase [Halobacteriovorax sp. HLS]